MAASHGLQLRSMTDSLPASRPAAEPLVLTEQPPAMLLAAGRGERMRPLTDITPKPLLAVQGQPLLQHHMQALAQAGVRRAVVNTGWLGAQIPARFGPRFGERLALAYSPEPEQAFETAGGIARALPQLGPVFWLAAGDVHAPDFGFPFEAARDFAASGRLAHLWLVPNPVHHPRGDFGIDAQGLARDWPEGEAQPRHTYSTIALLRAELFAPPWCDIPEGNPHGLRAPLAPLLRRAMAQGQVGATLYVGRWTDVGTPERLAQLNAQH
nr:nucleotidyltransferase family protein [Delftia sp. PS-11]